MESLNDAEVELWKGIKELANGLGRIDERLSAARQHMILGKMGIVVPPWLKSELDELEAAWDSKISTTGKIDRWIGSLTEEECVREAQRLLGWLDRLQDGN